MEESQNPKPINFQQQLLNLSNLQQQIEQTKKEVSQLLKIETSQHRHLQTIYQQSLMTTRNKLNQLHSHNSQQHLHHLIAQDVAAKQQKVRQLREKQEQDLREVRDMLKKSREKERLVIRNNSLLYDQTIKKNKKTDLELKEKLVKEMRKQKQNYKQSVAESRLQESKQKEVELFRNTLAKIDRQPYLLKELQRLNKEKEMIQRRVDEKKTLKEQCSGEVERLRRMKLGEVKELVGAETDSRGTHQEQMKLIRCAQSLDTLKTVLSEKKSI